jgi:hypothetical protein
MHCHFYSSHLLVIALDLALTSLNLSTSKAMGRAIFARMYLRPSFSIFLTPASQHSVKGIFGQCSPTPAFGDKAYQQTPSYILAFFALRTLLPSITMVLFVSG